MKLGYMGGAAAISIILLVSAALVVPSLSAYATHDNGNGKSQDDKSHQKGREGQGPQEPQRCLNGASDKYNKHCPGFIGHPGP